MATYQLGSSGAEVERIQRRLASLDVYSGPIDGRFGGGTDSAVRRFQKRARLAVDGAVGPETWRALFRKAIAPPADNTRPLEQRCMALTGTFETGQPPPECFAGLSGDFDGQGVSMGVLQWNFGQDSLQPLLREMLTRHAALSKDILQDRHPVLRAALDSDKEELMRFARSIQDPVRHFVNEPWRGVFKSLCRTPEFQAIQTRSAGKLLQAARDLVGQYRLSSQRALALMFDIKVQNGSISPLVGAQIDADFRALPRDLPADQAEVARMEIVANRRAEASNPRWVEDVRARKLCIARGTGTVHGIRYDLAEQFGIGLSAIG